MKGQRIHLTVINLIDTLAQTSLALRYLMPSLPASRQVSRQALYDESSHLQSDELINYDTISDAKGDVEKSCAQNLIVRLDTHCAQLKTKLDASERSAPEHILKAKKAALEGIKRALLAHEDGGQFDYAALFKTLLLNNDYKASGLAFRRMSTSEQLSQSGLLLLLGSKGSEVILAKLKLASDIHLHLQRLKQSTPGLVTQAQHKNAHIELIERELSALEQVNTALGLSQDLDLPGINFATFNVKSEHSKILLLRALRLSTLRIDYAGTLGAHELFSLGAAINRYAYTDKRQQKMAYKALPLEIGKKLHTLTADLESAWLPGEPVAQKIYDRLAEQRGKHEQKFLVMSIALSNLEPGLSGLETPLEDVDIHQLRLLKQRFKLLLASYQRMIVDEVVEPEEATRVQLRRSLLDFVIKLDVKRSQLEKCLLRLRVAMRENSAYAKSSSTSVTGQLAEGVADLKQHEIRDLESEAYEATQQYYTALPERHEVRAKYQSPTHLLNIIRQRHKAALQQQISQSAPLSMALQSSETPVASFSIEVSQANRLQHDIITQLKVLAKDLPCGLNFIAMRERPAQQRRVVEQKYMVLLEGLAALNEAQLGEDVNALYQCQDYITRAQARTDQLQAWSTRLSELNTLRTREPDSAEVAIEAIMAQMNKHVGEVSGRVLQLTRTMKHNPHYTQSASFFSRNNVVDTLMKSVLAVYRNHISSLEALQQQYRHTIDSNNRFEALSTTSSL